MKPLMMKMPLLAVLLAVHPSDARLNEAPLSDTVEEQPAAAMTGTPLLSMTPQIRVLQAAEQPDPIRKQPLKVATVGPMPTKKLPPIPAAKAATIGPPLPTKSLPPILSVLQVDVKAPQPTPPAMPTKYIRALLPPKVECLGLSRLCPDGVTTVSPDPNHNGCLVPKCPSEKKPCCNPFIQFRCAEEQAACCPDGNWVCPQGGVYSCQEEEAIELPDDDVCEKSCPKIAYLCPNGNTVEPDPFNGCQMPPCPEPEEPCCNPFLKVTCSEGGAYCCEDGSYTCVSPDGTYQCGDEEQTKKPLRGKICGKIIQ